MTSALEDLPGDLWVFGYGSLIWRPGFDFVERREARLVGAHRALCIYSFVHRGTPEKPGLVLGLDHGGMCRGVAYRVVASRRRETIDYLREREQVTSIYLERVRQVWLKSDPSHAGSPEQVGAVCYMVDRSHAQYAGRLSLDAQVRHVADGHGQSGPNREYVLSTVAALEDMGIRDRELHRLAQRLHGGHAPDI
ncbi:MAG TPA: gamma-glutamylcyclotransferase [Xanthobacteraceae bacterium]|nr:gamma-glutamylcyclotransferase [Xanthobacteraceae bacterium]